MERTGKHRSSSSYPTLEKPDILDIASQFTSLRRSGKWYSGLCPMHQERNPSFFVNHERQYYKCWSCGSRGDVIDLVMRVKGLSFKDALIYLGIQQPKTRSFSKKQVKDMLLNELKGIELEILFNEILRMHSYITGNWMRAYHRLLGLGYDFWLDDADLIREHMPDVMKQCGNTQEAQGVAWFIENAIKWRQELSAIHGGTFDEKIALYKKITGATE